MPENTDPQDGAEPQETSERRPPWGSDEDFNASKAWERITQQSRDIDKLRLQLQEAAPKVSEYERLVEASKTDLERKTEEVTRWQTEAERWRSTSLSSRIEVLAGQDFADPSDATAELSKDTSKYLDAGGVINEDAIKTDLAALLEKKPHWRRSDPAAAGPRVPVPNRAQGAGGSPAATTPGSAFAAAMQGALNPSGSR